MLAPILTKLPSRLFNDVSFVETLDDELFLQCVRLIQTGDRKDFHQFDGLTGPYGFTHEDWEMIAMKEPQLHGVGAQHRQAWRWFVHCWHECALRGIPITVWNVAVLWEWGIEAGVPIIGGGWEVPFADKVEKLYNKKRL